MTTLPKELEREIFDFAGYKLRNGKYMRQLNKNAEFEKLLSERPPIVKGKATIDLYYRKYHNHLVLKVIEITKNRRSYIKYYSVDFDGTRYEYEPSIPW